MEKMMQKTMDRRQFTSVAAALAALAGVTITIGCGSDSPTSGGNGGTGGSSSGDKVGSISGNHGHTAVISAATLAAGGDISLDIRGNSDHPHTVQLSAAELSSVAAGQRVSKESSSDFAHSHSVTFN
jgi:hypothetical protein